LSNSLANRHDDDTNEPGKKGYSDPKSYRLIILLKKPGKVFENISQNRLAFLLKEIVSKNNLMQ